MRKSTLTKLAKDSLQPAILLQHRNSQLEEQISALWLIAAAKPPQNRAERILSGELKQCDTFARGAVS